jgi:hypothetical protein
MARPKNLKGGRPPSGRSDRISKDYKQFTMYMPPADHKKLAAASAALRRPRWRVLLDAFLAYLGEGRTMTDDERSDYRKELKKSTGD